jgi:DNA-binding XRE family transcriptional regulator
MDERTLLKQWVKRLRRLQGYTQEQLAERIDINSQYLSSIERGGENPTLDILICWDAGARWTYMNSSSLRRARHQRGCAGRWRHGRRGQCGRVASGCVSMRGAHALSRGKV